MIDEIFSTQEARNKRAKQLKAQGYRVKRYSHRNQCLHPMYLATPSIKLSSLPFMESKLISLYAYLFHGGDRYKC